MLFRSLIFTLFHGFVSIGIYFRFIPLNDHMHNILENIIYWHDEEFAYHIYTRS